MKIVVGYDGSESAKRALERASSVSTDQDQVKRRKSRCSCERIRCSSLRLRSFTPEPQPRRALTSTRPKSSAGATISTRRRPFYRSAGSKQK